MGRGTVSDGKETGYSSRYIWLCSQLQPENDWAVGRFTAETFQHIFSCWNHVLHLSQTSANSHFLFAYTLKLTRLICMRCSLDSFSIIFAVFFILCGKTPVIRFQVAATPALSVVLATVAGLVWSEKLVKKNALLRLTCSGRCGIQLRWPKKFKLVHKLCLPIVYSSHSARH